MTKIKAVKNNPFLRIMETMMHRIVLFKAKLQRKYHFSNEWGTASILPIILLGEKKH